MALGPEEFNFQEMTLAEVFFGPPIALRRCTSMLKVLMQIRIDEVNAAKIYRVKNANTSFNRRSCGSGNYA